MGQKLTASQAEMVRVFAEFGYTKAALAREYGVHVDTVRNILRGTSFNGTTPPRKDRKLDEEQVLWIRQWAADDLSDTMIVKKLGGVVSRSTVRQVVEGRSYRDVAGVK